MQHSTLSTPLQAETAYRLTFFPSQFAHAKDEQLLTLPQLADMIRSTAAADKAALPWLKLAGFGSTSSAKGCYRSNANVLALSGIEADYDRGEMSFEAAAAKIEAAGIRALLYTSASHTAERPRWRVLCPFDVEYEVFDTSAATAHRDRMLDRLNGVLGGILSSESWTLSQSYYFGQVTGREAIKIAHTPGRYIDTLSDLDATAIGKARRSGGTDRAAIKTAPEEGLQESDDEPTLMAIGAHCVERKIAKADADPGFSGRTPTGNGTYELAGELADLRHNGQILSADAITQLIEEGGWTSGEGDQVSRTVVNALAYHENDRGCVDATAHDQRFHCDLTAYEMIPTPSAEVVELATVRQAKQIAQVDPAPQPAEKGGKHRSPPKIGWSAVLTSTTKKAPGFRNAVVALTKSPDLIGRLAYDEFRDRVTIRASLPWHSTVAAGANWSDDDTDQLDFWLQSHAVYATPAELRRAVMLTAKLDPFHPVRDYLRGLAWDGTVRLDTAAHHYFGADDRAVTNTFLARWMIGAVARIFQPGCQFDNMLVLEGPQKAGKSSALRLLGVQNAWFADPKAALGSKDASQQLIGKWIIEYAELDDVRKSQIETLKAFITRRIDWFRKPYAASPEDHPRQCALAGTTNPTGSGYLADPTGARRFWPIYCRRINLPHRAADRDQLWAEAVWRYGAGERWHIDADLEPDLDAAATAEADDRYEAGPWDDLIFNYVEGMEVRVARRGGNVLLTPATGQPLDGVTLADLYDVLGADRGQRADNAFVACLTHLGFQRCRIWSGPSRGQKAYFRTVSTY